MGNFVWKLSLEEDSYLFHYVQLAFEVYYLAYQAHKTVWFSRNLSDELKFLKHFEKHSETFSVVSAVPRWGFYISSLIFIINWSLNRLGTVPVSIKIDQDIFVLRLLATNRASICLILRF
jgi:hypothetical protein